MHRRGGSEREVYAVPSVDFSVRSSCATLPPPGARSKPYRRQQKSIEVDVRLSVGDECSSNRATNLRRGTLTK